MHSKLSDNPIFGNSFHGLAGIASFTALTEQTRDGAMVIDETGQVIYWNSAMESILGIQKSEALYHPIGQIHHRLLGEEYAQNHKIDDLQQEIMRSLEIGQAEWMEGIVDFNITLQDGSQKLLQIQCFPMSLKQGFMIACIIHDNTRERELLIQLKSEQELLQNILQNVQEIVFTFTPEGIFSFVSPGWVQLQGYTTDEIMAHSFSDFMHPDDVENAWKSVREVISTGLSVNDIEFRIARKDGAYAWYLSSASLVRNDQGDPAYIIGIATDISERKKMEAALRESEASLRFIQNNMNDIVLQSDLNGVYIYASPSYERLLGYSCLPGIHTIYDYIHPDDLPHVRATVQHAINSGELVRVEYQHLVKSGGYIWMESVGSVLRDDSGRPTGFQVTSRDITQRRLYQDKLEYLSIHDALTGLYNRTYFEEEARRLESGRFDPLSIIVLDSDGLKQVNDRLGHLVGDRLLQTVADLLKLSFRDSDIIARMGGDEFVVLCPFCGQNDIETLLQRLKNNIDIYNQCDPPVPVCLSFGHAVRHDNSLPITEVLRQADATMYEHKIVNRPESQRLFQEAGLF